MEVTRLPKRRMYSPLPHGAKSPKIAIKLTLQILLM